MENAKTNKAILDASERIRRYDKLIQKQTGIAVKPLRFDGYFNLLNKYGTQNDTTENYQYETEPAIADEMLCSIYEGNGLFARIIDSPAEEAMKHGFELADVNDSNVIEFYEKALDDLDWEEIGITAIKWTRLFGGAIAVMLIDDGRGIDEPLDWKNIRSIDGIRVYDRSVIQPDYENMFKYTPEDPYRARGNTIGEPEYYNIYSKYGSFRVHESRCLVFRNGVLPENCTNSIYEMWGMPEYIRIKRAMRDCELAHGNGPKMLEKAIQAVYKVKNLSELLSTDAGEDVVVKRLQTIDLARGLLNSIAIDSDNEDYDFKTFSFTGVSEIIDTTCNQLSALTSIPQTILFGRSPAGMNSTGESDMENWYSFVGRIQKRMLRRNLRYLLSVIFQAGVTTGEISEAPPINPVFKPLWSLSELEQAQLEQTKAATQQAKAATAQIYVGMQAVDPSEIRKGLADSGEFNIENLLDDYTEEELFSEMPEEQQEQPEQDDMSGQNTPSTEEQSVHDEQDNVQADEDDTDEAAAVYIVKDGKFLVGTRTKGDDIGKIASPGGHIKVGETPEQAAIRETEEEFGITPKELIPISEQNGCTLYLCTEYEGEPVCRDGEMDNPRFFSIEELNDIAPSLYAPFADGVSTVLNVLGLNVRNDGGPGSGNFGHSGVAGQVGGSAPSTSITQTMKESRKNVQLARPDKSDISKAFEGNDSRVIEIYNKYAQEVDDAEKSGDLKRAKSLRNQWTEETRKVNEDSLKKLGTYMENGYYVDSKFINDPQADIYSPQGVNKKEGCMNIRAIESSSNDDNIPSVRLSNSYVKITEEEAKTRILSSAEKFGYDVTLGGVSSTEEKAISLFTYASAANSALRNGQESEQAKSISSIIDRTASPQRTLYRGVAGEFAEKIKGLNQGDSFTEKGFMSTSQDDEVAKSFAGDNGALLRIRTPSGYGVGMSISPYSRKPEEAEVLINRGATVKILSKGNDFIDCELIPAKYENQDSSENFSENSKIPIDNSVKSGIVRVKGQKRSDADADTEFITVNGTHIPLVEGKAVGGPLKGEDFSKSKPVSAVPDKKTKSSNGTERKTKGESKRSLGTGNNTDEPAKPPSAHGENIKATGFDSNEILEDHFDRHGKALGCSSKEEYQKRGIGLLAKPCTDGIAGYARADGKVVRFNTKTGEYVSGYPGQNLCTYMIPKDSSGVDLARALDYYNKHRLADEKRYGTLK